MKTILIIEDDPAILQGLTIALRDEHYEVLAAGDGEQGELLAGRESIQCIILDLMLPKKNGLEVCRDLRARGVNTPILMLTSKKEELDKVMGLETGADDYMTKPFSIRELIARIKALLRRSGEISADAGDYAFGGVHVDFKTMEATRNGEPVKMSMREFEVLKYFIRHEGGVVTRDMLLNEVWGYDAFPTTRTVDNYVLSLRKKLEEDHASPRHLLTVHTAGYRFVK